MKRPPNRPANVSLRQMRAFVAAANEGSVTRAAQHMHLTPSALSMLIRGLEAELAVRLFDRLSRRIELTEAGREVAVEPLVLMQAGTGLRAISDRAFAALGERVDAVQEVAQVSTAIGLVEAGLGLAILPSYALAAARTTGIAAVPLTEPVVHRDIVALTAVGRGASAACDGFLAHFRQSMTDAAGADAPEAAATRTRRGSRVDEEKTLKAEKTRKPGTARKAEKTNR